MHKRYSPEPGRRLAIRHVLLEIEEHRDVDDMNGIKTALASERRYTLLPLEIVDVLNRHLRCSIEGARERPSWNYKRRRHTDDVENELGFDLRRMENKPCAQSTTRSYRNNVAYFLATP